MNRSKRDGTVSRKGERWYAVTNELDALTKRRVRKWTPLPDANSRTEARAALHKIVQQQRDGNFVDPTKITVAEFFEEWLTAIKLKTKPRTFERYEELAKKNILPLVGGTKLQKLRAADIDAAYVKALAAGRRDGKGGLSARTVHHMHRVLKQALAMAVRRNHLVKNPADDASPPRPEKARMTTYDMSQTIDLIEAMRGKRIYMSALLAVLCGLRRGEISALKWKDVDLAKANVTVQASVEQLNGSVRLKETKSGRVRNVALPATVCEELKAHRLRQAEILLSLGVRLTDDHFVCALEDGSMMQPTFITHEWVRSIKGTSLPQVRFHDLRHAHATHLLATGVHPKVASERLGHSKVGITLDLYSHVLPGMQEDAVAKVEAAFQAAQKGVRKP